MRILSYVKKHYLKKYIIMLAIIVILVIVLQITIFQILFSKEKYLVQKELHDITLWCVGYWSGKEADAPDGVRRNVGYDRKNQELLINIGDQKYKFQVDSLNSFEIESLIAYDLN